MDGQQKHEIAVDHSAVCQQYSMERWWFIAERIYTLVMVKMRWRKATSQVLVCPSIPTFGATRPWMRCKHPYSYVLNLIPYHYSVVDESFEMPDIGYLYHKTKMVSNYSIYTEVNNVWRSTLHWRDTRLPWPPVHAFNALIWVKTTAIGVDRNYKSRWLR